MTQDEIIEMARQAGLPEAIIEMTPIAFETFAKLVAAKERDIQGAAFEKILEAVRRSERAKEREACAKEADKWSKRDDDAGAFIGKAIRARGES